MSRALRVLGIRHILARSPEARGRSERAFGTIQGRLPQELRVAGITDYAAANGYLVQHFVPDFNRRFTVPPTQAGSACVLLVGVDLELLLSAQHERVVRNDSTVLFEALTLQLPQRPERAHYVRCPVLVHEFPQGTLGISYQGRLLARYPRDGQRLPAPARRPPAECNGQPQPTARPRSPRTVGISGAGVHLAAPPAPGRRHPAATPAPRVARRPTPRLPPPPGGAAAHNVDGAPAPPRHSPTSAKPLHPAVHNVDSSCRQRHRSEVRALRPINRKPKKNRSKISVYPSGHLKLPMTRTCVSVTDSDRGAPAGASIHGRTASISRPACKPRR